MQRSVKSPRKTKHYEEIVEKRFSNYRLMLYFGLLSISALFISLSLLYLFSRAGSAGKQVQLQLHPLFYINSLLLGASSIGLYFTGKYYHADDFRRFKLFLGLTLVTGVLFILGQMVAWFLQWEDGYSLRHSSAAYLYIISGLHCLHMLGGLAFMGTFSWKAFTELRDFPTSIIYFTDPIARHQLSNLTLYWHFMGALWLYLMAFFLLAK